MAYVQATSPLRRFTDWLTHAAVAAHLLARSPVVDFRDRVLAAESASREASRAMRRTHHYWRLKWLAARVGVPMDAVVLRGAAAGKRAEVLVIDPLVPTRAIAVGPVCAGQAVTIVATDIDPRAGRLKARIVATTG
jgi:exoribonuclease-2